MTRDILEPTLASLVIRGSTAQASCFRMRIRRLFVGLLNSHDREFFVTLGHFGSLNQNRFECPGVVDRLLERFQLVLHQVLAHLIIV